MCVMGERDDAGRYTQQYPDRAFLQAVDDLTVGSTQNVADSVGCSYDLAYRRLQTLESEGKVEREDVGPSFVWLPTES